MVRATKIKIESYLENASKEELKKILKERLSKDESLETRLSGRTLNANKAIDIKSYKKLIRDALGRSEFVHYRAVPAYTDGLEDVANGLLELRDQGNSQEAADLIEFLIDGCTRRIQRLDDSDGCFSGFVKQLYEEWGKAWALVKNRDPLKIAQKVLSRITKNDYGLEDGLIIYMKEALGKEGVTFIDDRIKAEFESAVPEKAESSNNYDFRKIRYEILLKDIADAKGDVDQFIEISKLSGSRRFDYNEIAQRLKAAGRFEEALTYVKAGLKESWGGRGEYELPRLKIDLLEKLGRVKEAQEAAWEFFKKTPCRDYLEQAIKLSPNVERENVRLAALDYCSQKAELSQAMSVFEDQKEFDRLADVVKGKPRDLRRLYYGSILDAAKKCEKLHPDVAIMLYRVLAFQILKEKRSRAYYYIGEYLNKVKKLYLRLGKEKTWERLIRRIKKKHRLKTSVLSYLERRKL